MSEKKQVRIIEPKAMLPIQSDEVSSHKLRVAAYARVSTEQDEQQNSYEAQVDYYSHYISNNPDWVFIGVFADKGITGTNTKNRDGFNEMIDLALNGGIDLILTKSISRFARNTVDTLQTVRELKAVNVEVIFEKENLHTFDPRCEVFLTIMSSLAQEESRSISENVRWGQQKRMKDGKIQIAYSRFLGYTKGEDGNLKIVEEEAKIVREIYDLYLSGISLGDIAKRLTARGILTPGGKKKWPISTVRSILSNEKYKGEALLQKTYTTDYLTKTVKKNNGEVRQFLVENSHEPIVSPEVFDHVQELLTKNQKRRIRSYTDYPFSGRIVCGDCGSLYGRDIWRVRSTGERYPIWYCNHKYDGDAVCQTPPLKEDQIMAAFEKMQIKRHKFDTSYSEERWKEIVKSMTVHPSGEFEFLLSTGEEIKIVP